MRREEVKGVRVGAVWAWGGPRKRWSCPSGSGLGAVRVVAVGVGAKRVGAKILRFFPSRPFFTTIVQSVHVFLVDLCGWFGCFAFQKGAKHTFWLDIL